VGVVTIVARGMCCVVRAVVTMFLGLYTPQLALPTCCRIVMVVYICFHAAVEMVLAIHMHASRCCPPASGEYTICCVVMFKIHRS